MCRALRCADPFRSEHNERSDLRSQTFTLLEHGTDVNVWTKYDTTPLHVAQNGRLDNTCVLLDPGTNVGVEDGHGRTASQVASERGYDHIMTLLEYGAR